MNDVVEPDDDAWVIALLGRLDASPMPEAVAQRLRNTISAESAARAEVAPEGVQSASVTDLGGHRDAHRPMWPWALAGGFAAAAAVIAVLVAQPFTGSNPSEAPIASGDQTTIVPISSGTAYTAANVADLVPRQMVPDRPQSAAPMAARQATFVATSEGIDDCLAGLGSQASELRMIDLASYDDLPVAVLAFLDNDADRTADVVVVGVRCNRTDPQVRLREVARITPAAGADAE